MTLRFWVGGPVAVKGTERFMEDFGDGRYWTNRKGTAGCVIAARAGARIPRDTYVRADPAYSQLLSLTNGVGFNDTALLPLEE